MTSNPPPGFMARCPECDHLLCGECMVVCEQKVLGTPQHTVAEKCHSCGYEFRLEGKSYGPSEKIYLTRAQRTWVLDYATEKLAAWMIKNSLATGHGDTFESLLDELEWQIKELWAKVVWETNKNGLFRK